MSLDTFAYNLGYWTARSGQPGVFVSAALRVGYQHGTVDLALDSRTIAGELRDRLRAVSRAHEAWYVAATKGDRAAQQAADKHSQKLMSGLVGEEVLREVSPALWARVHIAPGINLVL